MNVLIIITGRLTFDGITNSVLSYFGSMDRTDMHVDFINAVHCDEEIRNKISGMGFRIIDIAVRRNSPLIYIHELSKHIKRQNYDIVHAHGSSGMLSFEMLAAWIGRVKIRIAHSHSTYSQYKVLDKMLRPLLYILCTHRFACSNAAGKWLYGGRKFSIIPNARNLNQFLYNSETRNEYRNKFGLDGKLVIGHIGYFTNAKNHEFIVDVFNELFQMNKNAHLILVGDGKKRDIIEKMVGKHKLNGSVVFTGSLLDVSGVIQAFDIALLPSLYEGLGMVVLEWQLAGLPCYVSDYVPKECAFTDLVTFLPLALGARGWAEVISGALLSDRDVLLGYVYNQAKTSGLDIETNAKTLKTMYMNYIKRET